MNITKIQNNTNQDICGPRALLEQAKQIHMPNKKTININK